MKNSGKPQLILSMLIFGTIGIFRKSLSLSSSFIAFFRGLIGALFILMYILITKRKIDFVSLKRHIWTLVISGVLISLNWVFLFEAYNYTTVATATLCYYTAPIIIVLASPLVFKEKLTLTKIICAVASALGMVIITGFDGGGLKGILFGIAAAVLYAMIVLVNKKLDGIDDYLKTFIQLSVAGIAIMPYTIIKGDFAVGSLTGGDMLMLLTLGVVHTGLAYLLYFGSLPKLPAQTAAIYSFIDPVFAVLLSIVFLNEPFTPSLLVGALLILGGAFFQDFSLKKSE